MHIRLPVGFHKYGITRSTHGNPFRRATFRNCSEMDAVAGSPGDDGFIRQVKEDTAAVLERIARLKSVLS